MGSLWKLPVIYLCENNGYAITTSVALSHGQPDIARRADAYGFPGITVDGQDIEAVYGVTCDAASRARRGEGPTLIEAKTYRFDEHQVGLIVPGEKYRSDVEVESYRTGRDPIVLYRAKLLAAGITTSRLDAIEAEVAQAVAEAIRFGEESPLPDPATLADFLYSNPIQ
jgi:pyruvate dehydrogenase E1 component alpha subunit